MATCKLCGLEKKLIKAHIIPEFMYKPLYNENHKFYELTKEDNLKGEKVIPYKQIGEFDKDILCEKCDNELLGSLEKYAQKVFFRKDLSKSEMPDCKNYKIKDYEFSECSNVSYKKMKLFLLSILWRSHITNRPFFNSVSLGPHADKIKDIILKCDPKKELNYPIIITSFVRADYHYNDLILKPRKAIGKDGLSFYIFSIGSFQFYFFVNSLYDKIPDDIKCLTLKENDTMKIIHFKNGQEKTLINKFIE